MSIHAMEINATTAIILQIIGIHLKNMSIHAMEIN
jgi:hypothetical protein